MPVVMPLVSTLLAAGKVYANMGSNPANVRDGSWVGWWAQPNVAATVGAPQYIALDISGLGLTTVLSHWITENLDYDTAGAAAYQGVPGDYKIQANAAAGGSLPASGWVDLVTVTGNTYHARMNILALGGYNWVRIYVTADASTAEQTWHKGFGLYEWQLYDATGGYDDTWMFLGDSITSAAVVHNDTNSFDVLVKASIPTRTPAWHKGSHGNWAASSYLPTVIDDYLAVFPGYYVPVALGTNDLNGDFSGTSATTFYNNMKTICDRIIAAGKKPVIPRIIYSPNASYGPPNTNHYKAKIDLLWAHYGADALQGPDLYTPFFDDATANGGPNTYWSGSDNLHPNLAGQAKIRALWAEWAIANVYGAPSVTDTTHFVSRSGTGLVYHGQPYVFYGLNAYNANNRTADFCWYAMQNGSTLADSFALFGPGFVLRAWFFQKFVTTAGVRDWAAFDKTLDAAAAAGVKVIVTLTDGYGDCDFDGTKDAAWFTTGFKTTVSSGHTQTYKAFVEAVVARYKARSEVLMWQLGNELDGTIPGYLVLRSFADEMGAAVKALDPSHLLSLGTLATGALRPNEFQHVHSSSYIDICEYHDYDGQARIPIPEWTTDSATWGVQARITDALTIGKPIFCGEVGINSENPVFNYGVQAISHARKAEIYRAKFIAQKNAGVCGFLPWVWNNGSSTEFSRAFEIASADAEFTMLQEMIDLQNPAQTIVSSNPGMRAA